MSILDESSTGRLTLSATRDVRRAIARSSSRDRRRSRHLASAFWGWRDRDQRDDHADDEQHRVLAVIRSSLGVSRSLHFHRPAVCALVHSASERVNPGTPRDSQQQYRLRRPRSDRRGLRVHSGTAPFSDSAYSSGMQLVSLKGVLATVWLSAALIAGIAGNLNSVTSWTVLAGVAVIPPIVEMMLRWNAPRQTMSESIQEGRR